MNASAWHIGRVATRNVRPILCRFVVGRRLPHRGPAFHTSLSHRRNDTENASSQNAIDATEVSSKTGNTDSGESRVTGSPGDVPESPSKPKDTSNYGSASRRAGRNVRRPKEIPQPYIPPWFLERNVALREEAGFAQNLSMESASATQEPPDSNPKPDQQLEDQKDKVSKEDTMGDIADYLSIDSNVTEEVASLVKAGLWLPHQDYADSIASIRPHLVLSCPRPGGSAYLDNFVADTAKKSNADVLRLSAQDIAEIGGDYMESEKPLSSSSLSTLGYDVAGIGEARLSSAAETTRDESEENDEDEEDEEQEFEHSSKTVTPTQFGAMSVSILPRGALNLGDLGKLFKMPSSDSSGQSSKANAGKPAIRFEDDIDDSWLSMLVETLLKAPDSKRAFASILPEPKASAGSPNQHFTSETSSLIVIVEDYPQINLTVQGNKFLDKLHNIVDERRSKGQSMLIIGTSSSDRELAQGDHKVAVDDAQTRPWEDAVRTIIVPIKDRSAAGRLWNEHKRKIRQTNLRHLREMLRRTAPGPAQVSAIVDDWHLSLESQWAFVAGLDQSVWSLDKVNRIAIVALGLLNNSNNMTRQTIEAAFATIDASDNSKYKWWKKHMNEKQKGSEDPVAPSIDTQADSEDRMRKLKKKCNTHEKKLLSGVIDASSIRTTFADVQAPQETIEALKTLTSLSLIRPDAFTYGVLATDRIPGLLLYGPPGTGKTLLAKAVAKESGATMLEVSGSDVYDMYVGEGEKNVKAIFTLAKKLSPCIVFIDEADAILGSRSSGQGRTSHRELINQFLREWDGVTDMNAFIMVATNRPFDLDEASLRRLPRRLLVDLPLEKDREAILNLHLKDELLDSAISIPQMALQTPFYSGSDLKNLCVAAALACVREEFECAIAWNKGSPEEPYQYAEKRTLFERHFTKAMEEISASISEDMGSLSAIRKFDEKYGDRRGRRKKLGRYGFKTVDDSEKLDSARVRNRI